MEEMRNSDRIWRGQAETQEGLECHMRMPIFDSRFSRLSAKLDSLPDRFHSEPHHAHGETRIGWLKDIEDEIFGIILERRHGRNVMNSLDKLCTDSVTSTCVVEEE